MLFRLHTTSFAGAKDENCEEFDNRRGFKVFVVVIAGELMFFALFAAKKNISGPSPLRFSPRSFAWKKLSVLFVGSKGLARSGRSLVKLETFANFRRGGAMFSDLALLMESERSRIRGAALSYVGVRPRTKRGSTVGAGGPKLGRSTAVGRSLPSVFIRRLRSEDRFVTVTGILLSILFVGVLNPHPAFAVVKLELSPFDASPLTGVIRPLFPVSFAITPFRGVFPVVVIPSFRFPLDPGVPTIVKLMATTAVVTRASAALCVLCRRSRLSVNSIERQRALLTRHKRGVDTDQLRDYVHL